MALSIFYLFSCFCISAVAPSACIFLTVCTHWSSVMLSLAAGSKCTTAYLERTPGMPLEEWDATDLPATEWIDGFSLVLDLYEYWDRWESTSGGTGLLTSPSFNFISSSFNCYSSLIFLMTVSILASSFISPYSVAVPVASKASTSFWISDSILVSSAVTPNRVLNLPMISWASWSRCLILLSYMFSCGVLLILFNK